MCVCMNVFMFVCITCVSVYVCAYLWTFSCSYVLDRFNGWADWWRFEQTQTKYELDKCAASIEFDTPAYPHIACSIFIFTSNGHENGQTRCASIPRSFCTWNTRAYPIMSVGRMWLAASHTLCAHLPLQQLLGHEVLGQECVSGTGGTPAAVMRMEAFESTSHSGAARGSYSSCSASNATYGNVSVMRHDTTVCSSIFFLSPKVCRGKSLDRVVLNLLFILDLAPI